MKKQRISPKQFEALKYLNENKSIKCDGKTICDDKTIHGRTMQCLFNHGLVGWIRDGSGCSWGITGKGENVLK